VTATKRGLTVFAVALVGSALMSGADPGALAREMILAGRRARHQWY